MGNLLPAGSEAAVRTARRRAVAWQKRQALLRGIGASGKRIPGRMGSATITAWAG
jgi:hypothetical protein